MPRPKSEEYLFLGEAAPIAHQARPHLFSLTALITAICCVLIATASFSLGRHTAPGLVLEDAGDAGVELSLNIPRKSKYILHVDLLITSIQKKSKVSVIHSNTIAPLRKHRSGPTKRGESFSRHRMAILRTL